MSVLRFSVGGVLLLLGSAVAFSQTTEALPKPPGSPRALVLPGTNGGLQEELSTRDGTVKTESVETERRSLKAIRSDASVMDSVRAGGWDFVVLLGHRTFGKALLIEGEARVGNPSDFLLSVGSWWEDIRRSGARAVLLVPPRKPGTPALDQQAS